MLVARTNMLVVPVASAPVVATSTTKEIPPVGSPKDATYIIEGVPVTLVAGHSEVPAVPGSASTIETDYFGNEATYDFNHDGRMDTVVLLTQSTGGTGVFYYVAVALGGSDGYHGSAAFRLGDRISPQSIWVDTDEARTGTIEVSYADRAEGESYAVAPSIGKQAHLQFDVAKMELSVVKNR